MWQDIEKTKEKVLYLIDNYPKSKNKQPYLVMKNWRKLFFDVFIKKYGIDGTKCEYTDSDVKRRIRLVEFFPYFIKEYNIKSIWEGEYAIESHFHIMIISERWNQGRMKMELLSFYSL